MSNSILSDDFPPFPTDSELQEEIVRLKELSALRRNERSLLAAQITVLEDLIHEINKVEVGLSVQLENRQAKQKSLAKQTTLVAAVADALPRLANSNSNLSQAVASALQKILNANPVPHLTYLKDIKYFFSDNKSRLQSGLNVYNADRSQGISLRFLEDGTKLYLLYSANGEALESDIKAYDSTYQTDSPEWDLDDRYVVLELNLLEEDPYSTPKALLTTGIETAAVSFKPKESLVALIIGRIVELLERGIIYAGADRISTTPIEVSEIPKY